MSRKSNSDYLIWLSIGGFIWLIKYLIENQVIILYILLGVIGISLLKLFLNYIHTVYLINFNSNIKSILKFNEEESLEHFRDLLDKNQKIKIDIDERYLRFISSSKIFDSK